MKKHIRDYKKLKRAISLLTATAMIWGELPLSCVSNELSRFFPLVSQLFTVSADDEAPTVEYYDRVEYDKQYGETGYILIESWSDFIWYSQSYFNYSYGKYTTSIQHEKDVLFINIKDSAGNTRDLNANGVRANYYVPIGNDTKPFEGKLIFSNTSPDTFNIPESLFGTISETVKILGQDETTVKSINITRTGTGSGDCLFAQKVKSDNDSLTKSDWQLVFDEFDNSSVVYYAGAIGEIEEGANVKLTMTNNALLGITNLAATASSADKSGKPVNAGILCGTLNKDATLEATYSTTDPNYSSTNTNYSITSDNGHAGGLVGEMGYNSTLTVTATNLQGTASVYASNGYAGGVVGLNDGGTVTITPSAGETKYEIKQFIHGGSGAGGVFGYYAPLNGTQTLDVSTYNINNCTVESETQDTGYAGGLIGVLENKIFDGQTAGSNLTIDGGAITSTVVSTHNTSIDAITGNPSGGYSKAYGGLIGSYEADLLSDSLIITNLLTTPANTLASPLYGGGIGEIIGASYVKFDNFTLNSAAGTRSGTFGGLVAKNANGYIYADGSAANTDGIKIGTSTIDGFTGGGLVGDLGDGVLGMKGTINLSNAKPTAADDTNGVIVGSRDNALIYAEAGWTYTPNTATTVDNVGSWGDVLCFDTGEGSKLQKDNVFTEANHAITIGSIDCSQIADADDFARVSLLFQIDTSDAKNAVITKYGSTGFLPASTNLTFTGTIDLSNTGLRGITRDGTAYHTTYSGAVDGNSNLITLDIKNVGGAGRPVYRHKYNGLFAIADGATFEYVNLDGEMAIQNVRSTKDDTTCYAGALAAQASTSFSATSCGTKAIDKNESNEIISGLVMTIDGSSAVNAGRLLGVANAGIGTITISSGTYAGIITGANSSESTHLGGIIGQIGKPTATSTWTFSDTTLKGTVENTHSKKQCIGGLVASLNGAGKATVSLSGVYFDGLTVSGVTTSSQGGLLGYYWHNADVNVVNVSTKDSSNNALATSNVSMTGAGNTAGLVYEATGHWIVTKLDLSGIKMTAASAKSIGMIVNQGTITESNTKYGIYLELPKGYAYTLSLDSNSSVNGVFDEICAYSAPSGKIMENGQGIISISSYDGTNNSSLKLKMESSTNEDEDNTGITYQAQTAQGKVANPNSRYYYNLDQIDIDNALTLAPEKLMRWGVYKYAAGNINKYFKDTSFAFNASDDYDMRGYSWYPITLSSATSIAGRFILYNEELTETEGEKAARNSNNDLLNHWKPLESNQHYMMQNALFYNVNANLTIGATTLAGTIGAVNDTSGTGALIYGTVKGSSPAQEDITVIDSTNGSISLDGIRVWNLSTYSSYAPLLINQASDYVTFKINDVTTTDSYVYSETVGEGDSAAVKDRTLDAATSLIGKAGNRAVAENDTPISQGITVIFTKIKLDGRDAEDNDVYAKSRYNTTKSIFTEATLLQQLIGSSGTYYYTYDLDWGATGNHYVTYGKEVGYTTTGQCPGEEQMYDGEVANKNERYTHPDSAPAGNKESTAYTGFGDFLKYVADVSTKAEIDGKTGFKYQLKVNRQAAQRIYGCGTYNDPYIITSDTDLVNISKWIKDPTSFKGEKLYIDPDGDDWCDAKTEQGEDEEEPTVTLKAEHIEYSCNANGTCTSSDPNAASMNTTQISNYLAKAYYQFDLTGTSLNLTSTSGFVGLGTATRAFSGVLDGGDSVVPITNRTQYPLINYSSGCVVRKLNMTVNATITLDNATDCYDYITGNKEHGAYGAVIPVHWQFPAQRLPFPMHRHFS